MLPFTIAHYRRMFRDPVIILHDNGSTDETLSIARKERLTIIPFVTEGFNDVVQSQIKSDAVKNSTADWVLCIDCDEECLINDDDLKALERREDINVIEFDGWDIIDRVDSPWDIKKPKGCKSAYYCKPILIKAQEFTDIRFSPGAHHLELLTPKAGRSVGVSEGEYKLLHYKCWSRDWYVHRSAELGARLSEVNKQNKLSLHTLMTEQDLTDEFTDLFNQRVIIEDKRIK